MSFVPADRTLRDTLGDSVRCAARRPIWWTLVIATLAFAALVFLYFCNPSDVPHFPRCPFLALTGYQCPGCGTLRGIHSLLHFRFRDAWGYNPFLVVSIPMIAALTLSPRFRRSPRVSKTVLAVILVYWLLRNTGLGLFLFGQ